MKNQKGDCQCRKIRAMKDCSSTGTTKKNCPFLLAVSQILDSLEDTQWLTIGDRLELDFLQKLFEDKQLRTLLEVRFSESRQRVANVALAL